MSGITGGGNELWLTSGSDTLTKVLGLSSVGRPNLAVSTVDSTDQDSGNINEFLASTADPGELQAVVKYVPGSPTDVLILEHLASMEKRAFKIVLKTETDTTEDVLGNLILTGYEPDEGEVGELRTATLTAKISGATTQAATS